MFSTNSNIINVAFNYIQQLKISVTKTSFKEQLLTNPYYPSLYSLSNVFERLNINSEACKIEQENFDELSPPFIAYLKNQSNGKDFVLVTSVSEVVKYIGDSKKEKTTTREKFLKDFLNIVFVAEKNDDSGEADFIANLKKEVAQKNISNALITGATLIFISFIYSFLHVMASAYLFTVFVILAIKLLGLTVTLLLLIYEIDKRNSFVKSICTAGKQTSCDAVLHSRAAKVLGMSWSEAGFFYFASTFLFILFPGITFTTKVCLLSIANGFASPYILFSVYYQWKVVRHWCPLCLTVQAVLALELIWSIINYWSHPYLPVAHLSIVSLPITCCITFPVVLWFSLKSLFIKAKDEPIYKAAYKRLLYNPETFQNLLQQQPIAPDGYQNLGITIGNSDAVNTIIKVCNPYCGPCAKAHPMLEEIVHNNKNVKVTIIFMASIDLTDKRGIAKHLLAINAKQISEQTKQALDDWYLADIKDYEVFADKYPMNGELQKQEQEIERMNKWCKEAEITATPTLFINGHRLPENYKIEELKYIL